MSASGPSNASAPAERAEPPTPETDVVRAFCPAGPGRHGVVAWTRRHARRTDARVEILVDADPDVGDPAARDGADRRGGAPALVDGLREWVWTALSPRHSLSDRLGRASAGARMLVVPQTLPGIDELVDTAYEPVTVVPDDTPHARGPVVLALASRTPDHAVTAAFEAAARRGAPMIALSLRDTRRWTVVTARDAVREADDERQCWADHLSAWRMAYPGVPVELRVGDGDPAAELVDLSGVARLLVLGRSGRGRVLGAVTPSPVALVVRRARCPVTVVPTGGPPRRSWWPRR